MVDRGQAAKNCKWRSSQLHYPFIIENRRTERTTMEANNNATNKVNQNDANHIIFNDDPEPKDSHSLASLLQSAFKNPNQLTAMLSNYSTSYNTVNVGIVLPVLKYSLSQRSSRKYQNDGPSIFSHANNSEGALLLLKLAQQDEGSNGQSDEEDSIVASSLLAGMIIGQMLGGFLGDAFGRRNAMMFVMALQIGASLGSAFIRTGDHNDGGLGTLETLAIWRFILGIGAGGVYPLAAVMSAEDSNDVAKPKHNHDGISRSGYEVQQDLGQSCSNNEESHRQQTNESSFDEQVESFQRVALTFSMQGLGFITVPLLSYPMLAFHWNIDFIWRSLLGLGALPGFFVMYLRLFRKEESPKATSYSVDEQLSPRRNEIRSLEITQHANDDEISCPMEVVSTLFNTMVEGDPSSHISDEHQRALVDNPNHTNIDRSEQYEGFDDDDATGFNNTLKSEDDPAAPIQPKASIWSSIRSEPNLSRKLFGTAGTWFLFDVLFYGNTLFEPVVLEAAFGSKDGVEDGYTLLLMAVRDSLMISVLSLPGYFATVLVIGKQTCVCRSIRNHTSTWFNTVLSPCTQSPALIQMQGFFVMFLLYLIIGTFWASLSNIQWLLLGLYAGSFFFANFGPNSTTFLLPSVTYSKECRSTLNGISAAAGKLGALVGASAFEPAADKWGESVVMVGCAVVSLFGFVLTKICVRNQKGHEHCM